MDATTSFGNIIEGYLSLIDGAWVIVSVEGNKTPLQDFISPWADCRVRLTVADLDALQGIKPGTEAKYVKALSNQEIANRLKKR